MRKQLSLLLIFFGIQYHSAQLTIAKDHYTHRDSLQGGLRPERTCFDVQRYDLNIKINIEEKSITGYNDIHFKVNTPTSKIQIDLFENMQVDSIIHNAKKLDYKRDAIATFIHFPNKLLKGTEQKIRFYYSGKPVIAHRAPWDGGFIFTQDNNGTPWIATACQGFGASSWYPVKDSQSDEPDLGATIKIAVPNGLMNISNGRFLGSKDLKNGYTRWDWEVKNPINTYDITVNIGDYVLIEDHHKGLDLKYYVLRNNESKARKHFEEVKPMMDCFQSKFGEYPFKEDSYKLVETPYLGMEHQSAIAYGNKYKKGYQGRDLSGTGIGLLFDYITIHETGHEWFGNSITSKDIADMWIHEAFTMYSEVVFVECLYGYEKALDYCDGLRINIANDRPMIGDFGVNKEGSGDMYYKGANMLNTLRHVIGKEKWWNILLNFSKKYKKQIIEGKTVIDFFNKESKMNLTPIFNQYLKYTTIPILEIQEKEKKYEIRWITEEPNFEMPIELLIKNQKETILVTNKWKTIPFDIKKISEIQPNKKAFYIKYQTKN
ncbi:M1 family metallopeptidase [Flavobacterium oreochromis]|uniref:Peptidase M1 n=2 Tax=Flavobacterium TaxID=237 RepID=A0A246GBJ3_9FLAO|nr:M1 family metallopeptidase [Flavobacterium oreochromis]OWP76611.1 peptidase M1 [Flavobacterium oreochromis]OWP77995.1 peptidase M1 [Flavobacterium oreochromis]POR25875.1 peptidase M1 [Flavobacterium columnare]